MNKWIALCKKIDAKDNDPQDRDEQRAWYDTLRDFAPLFLGLKPTVRLFAGDMIWCSLDPNNNEHVKEFKSFLDGKEEMQQIEIRQEKDPLFCRVIIAGPWKGKKEEAKTLLEKVCDSWPKRCNVKFLMTCGGFVQFEWPTILKKNEVGNNLYPEKDAIDKLYHEARSIIDYLLSQSLRNRLAKYADYLTIGVDSKKEKISTTQNYIRKLPIG